MSRARRFWLGMPPWRAMVLQRACLSHLALVALAAFVTFATPASAVVEWTFFGDQGLLFTPFWFGLDRPTDLLLRDAPPFDDQFEIDVFSIAIITLRERARAMAASSIGITAPQRSPAQRARRLCQRA